MRGSSAKSPARMAGVRESDLWRSRECFTIEGGLLGFGEWAIAQFSNSRDNGLKAILGYFGKAVLAKLFWQSCFGQVICQNQRPPVK